MGQDYPIHVSEGENGLTWSFLTQTNVCGEVACHIQPSETIELFIRFVETEFVNDIIQDCIKHLVNEQGLTAEEATNFLNPLYTIAIQDYTDEAMRFFRSKLPEAIRDIFTSLFFESVQHALSTMSGKVLYRADSPNNVLPFVKITDRARLINQVVKVSKNAAKKRMNAQWKGRPKLEPKEIENKILKAIHSLCADNERVSKAAVARRLNLGSEGNRTQALNNQLKMCSLDWEDLKLKTEVK